jgi:hypothetical protein
MSELLAHIPFQSRPSADWTIEPLRRGDIVAVTELFEAMSAKSRRQRFLTAMPRLSDRMLAFLSDVDGERHIAVAARVRGMSYRDGEVVAQLTMPYEAVA